jgi:vacuolar-type H+-ATPase subunit I/STV1
VLARTRRFRLILATTLGAAVLAAGCGEDETKEFRDGLDEAHKTFQRELTQGNATVQAAARSKSVAQYGQGINQLREANDRFKEDLDELETPSDAENEQEALNEAVDEFSIALGQINSAVQARDRARIQTLGVEVSQKGAQVDQAVETLKEAVE